MAIIGIGLGTTNSLAAVWRDGKSELIPNALGEYLTLSVVSVTAVSGINRLGGRDFDAAIMKGFCADCGIDMEKLSARQMKMFPACLCTEADPSRG